MVHPHQNYVWAPNGLAPRRHLLQSLLSRILLWRRPPCDRQFLTMIYEY